MRQLKVGSRSSRLSLLQTDEVVQALGARHPGISLQVVTIGTRGDSSPEAPLTSMGRGIFVKEIEGALASGDIDMAVHSLKDMTTELPPGLVIGAVAHRADPHDVLVNRWSCPLASVPAGARIGTSSPRRVVQLREARPDLVVLPIRGNVETRLRKAHGDGYDGAVLAAAGLQRLGLTSHVAEALPVQQFVPAPGQGALALEVREDDEEVLALVKDLDDWATRTAVTAERAFLEAMGGGCQVPVGAYARLEVKTLVLHVFLAHPDASTVLRAEVSGDSRDPVGLGMEAYRKLLEMGASEILAAQAS